MFKIKPITVFTHPGLYLQNLPAKGRGVFCAEDVKAGDVLEVAPLLIFNESDTAQFANTLVHDYYFTTSTLPQEMTARAGVKDAQKGSFLVMGISSFCNHLLDPNAKASTAGEYSTVFYKLTALKDIPKDTEICINYGISWFAARRTR